MDAYKQGLTRVMVSGTQGFAQPLLTGFGCVTTTQEALVTDQGQADREGPSQPKMTHPVDAPVGEI